MMLVTFASLYSFEPDQTPRIQIPHFDKGVHFTFYGVAAVLGIFSFRDRLKKGLDIRKLGFLLGISLFVFGIIIEVIQHKYTSRRTGDIFDVLANGLGALAGIGILKSGFSSKKGLN
ncbi:MAG: VanZ family protein [Bacteroidota bacterium]